MSDLDTKKIISHLEDKWKGKPCPMCGAKMWGITDSIYEMREYHKEGFIVGAPLIPVIPVVCGNCGNTVLISAVVAGVTKQDTVEKK